MVTAKPQCSLYQCYSVFAANALCPCCCLLQTGPYVGLLVCFFSLSHAVCGLVGCVVPMGFIVLSTAVFFAIVVSDCFCVLFTSFSHFLTSFPYFLHRWQHGQSAEACVCLLHLKHPFWLSHSHTLSPSLFHTEHKSLYLSQGIWLVLFTLVFTPGSTHLNLRMGRLIPLCVTLASPDFYLTTSFDVDCLYHDLVVCGILFL